MKRPTPNLAAPIAAMLAAVAVTTAIAAAGGQYAYDRPGDKRFVNNTAVLERTSPSGGSNQL